MAKLSPRLNALKDLPFTAQEQRREAALRSDKISIQGVQAKVSAKLSVKNQSFELIDIGGTYIIKPQSDTYEQVPENEGLTMKLAELVGIEVPVSGLVYCKDGSMSYFIKRFDRYGKNKKYHQEDFAQLTNNTRDTKYNWSMEKLIPVLEHCTFPALEKLKLFRRTLFFFLTGNEDMHLKNFSLITRGNRISLSPAYDLLNSTIVINKPTEELALTLKGKKRKIKKEELIEYYAKDRMSIPEKPILKELATLSEKRAEMEMLIRNSFLNENLIEKYMDVLSERFERLEI